MRRLQDLIHFLPPADARAELGISSGFRINEQTAVDGAGLLGQFYVELFYLMMVGSVALLSCWPASLELASLLRCAEWRCRRGLLPATLCLLSLRFHRARSARVLRASAFSR